MWSYIKSLFTLRPLTCTMRPMATWKLEYPRYLYQSNYEEIRIILIVIRPHIMADLEIRSANVKILGNVRIEGSRSYVIQGPSTIIDELMKTLKEYIYEYEEIKIDILNNNKN